MPVSRRRVGVEGKLAVRNRQNHGKGEVRLSPHSSLCKLARAMRRGKVPDERQVILDAAVDSAKLRRVIYLNSCPSKQAFSRARKFFDQVKA